MPGNRRLAIPAHLARRARALVGARGRTAEATRASTDRDLILRSGFFDQEWIEKQLGERYDGPERAVDAYLQAGNDCSPHPLFVRAWLERGRRARPGPGDNALAWYLTTPAVHQRCGTHPLVDVERLCRNHPEYAAHEFGPVVAWLATIAPHSELPAPEGWPTSTWARVRQASFHGLEEWRELMRFRHAPRRSERPPQHLITPAPRTAGSSPTPDRPAVTIVMPLWNRAGVVRRAIESVQAQTFVDWELIVVDDGSEDDGVAVVRDMAAADRRIVCVQADHGGVSRARNLGIERARGRYIAFLDSDNAWRPEFLQVMVDQIDTHGWGMAHAVLLGHQGETTFYRAFEGSLGHLLISNYIDLNVLVARTELVRTVGGFDTGLRRGVDHDLVLKLAKHTEPHLVPYIGVDYEDHEDGGPRISTTESADWFAAVVCKHLVDWDRLRTRDLRPGFVSVVVSDEGALHSTVDALSPIAGSDRHEIVLVGTLPSRARYVALRALAEAWGNLKLAAVMSRRGPAVAVSVGLAAADGEYVVAALRPLALSRDSLDQLTAPLQRSDIAAVQPALIGAAGEIASAGAVLGDHSSRLQPLLAGQPESDLDGREPFEVGAALGDLIAVRHRDVARVGGLDPVAGAFATLALSLRLRTDGGGRVICCPQARFRGSTFRMPDGAALEAPLEHLARQFPR